MAARLNSGIFTLKELMGSKWSSNSKTDDISDVSLANSGYDAYFDVTEAKDSLTTDEQLDLEEPEKNLKLLVNTTSTKSEPHANHRQFNSYPSENSFLRYSFNGNEATITSGDLLRSQLTTAADNDFDRQFERANQQWNQHRSAPITPSNDSSVYRRGSTPAGKVSLSTFQPSPNRRVPNDRHRRLVLKRSQTSDNFPELNNISRLPSSGGDHHRPRIPSKMSQIGKEGMLKNRSQSVQYSEPVSLPLHATKTHTASSDDLTSIDKHHQHCGGSSTQRRGSNKKVFTTKLLSPPQINMIRSVWNQLLATKGAAGVGGLLFQRICFKRGSVKDVFMESDLGEKYANHDVMMKSHAKLMAEVVDRAIQNLETLESLDSWLEDIGRSHGHLFEVGFAPQMWDVFMEAFADCAVREWGEKNKRTEDARVAWMVIITRITEKMKMGFQEQRKKPRPK